MIKTQTNKATKKATPRVEVAWVSPQSERYEKRESGFYLIKTTASGVEVETPLSTFTASILTEIRSENDKGDQRVEGFAVEVKFKDWVKVFNAPAHLSAESFDEFLLERASAIHPLASVFPNRERHVVAAIKALSSPAVYVKNGDGKQLTPKTNQR